MTSLAAAAARAGTLDDAAEAVRTDPAMTLTLLTPAAELGQLSGIGWYDLGLARGRVGDLPSAVASLRRASELRPRDGDVAEALAVARSMLDGAPPPVQPPALCWFLTPFEAAVVAALTMGLAARSLWTRPTLGAWLLWGLGGAGAAVAGSAHATMRDAPVAVIQVATAVRDAPEASATRSHDLALGSEVGVVAEEGAWRLVLDGENRRGWVPQGALIEVVR